MPRTAPVVESPAEVRRQVRAELAAERRAELAAERAERRQAPRRRPAPVSPAPAYTPQLGTLAGLLADLARAATTATRPPARPRPATPAPPATARPSTPPPAAAPPVALTVSPVPEGSPYAVGPFTAQTLAAIGQRDYLSPVPAGDCPFYVVNRGAMCGLAAPYRVLLGPGAFLPACQGHAYSIRTQCAQHGVPFRAYPPLN